MARYSIYDGGNLRNYPWESDRNSGIDPAYPVRYSAHLTNFHKVLRYHVDFQNDIFSSWSRESVADGGLVANDDLVVLLLGQGTKVADVVVQIKGVCPPMDPGAPGYREPPVFEIRIENADGTLAPEMEVGAADYMDGDVLGPIVMDDTGYVTYFGLNRFISGTHGFITMRLISGDASCACFGVMANIVQFIDPHACECVAPCGADFPDPNCPPTGLVTITGSNDGSGGTGLLSTPGDAGNDPESVTVTPATGDISEASPTLQLTAVVGPAPASPEVVWATSNAAVATVSPYVNSTNRGGLVTRVGVGTVTITASSIYGPSDTSVITSA